MLLAERSQHQQNPLKLFELLLKGFCPTTVIVDRVDVHDDDLDDAPAPMVRTRKAPVVAAPKGPTTRPRQSASPSKIIPTTNAAPLRSAKRARTNQQKQNRNDGVNHHHEKPFEIGERPPSDVLGISKKMLQGFCYNPLHKSDPALAPKHKLGFCSILTDHIGCFSVDDGVPDGEECSVDTCASSNVGVDLSPQSSCPRNHELLTNDECFDDDEILPIAEYQHRRSYRLTHVLILTFLAMYTTLALIQSLGPNKVLFAMERKHRRYPNNPKPITFSISTRAS